MNHSNIYQQKRAEKPVGFFTSTISHLTMINASLYSSLLKWLVNLRYVMQNVRQVNQNSNSTRYPNGLQTTHMCTKYTHKEISSIARTKVNSNAMKYKKCTCSTSLIVVQYIMVESELATNFEISPTNSSINWELRIKDLTP